MSTIIDFRIGKVGNYAENFLNEKLLLLFPLKGVMSEVKNYSILVDEINFYGKLKKGQTFYINEEPFEITAVGEISEKNLHDINHATFKADGSKEATLPGTIYLEDKDLPVITENTELKIKD